MLRDGAVVIPGCASGRWWTNKINNGLWVRGLYRDRGLPGLTRHARPNKGRVAEPVFEAFRRLNSNFSRSCKLIVYSVMNQSSSLIQSYEMV